MPKPGVSGLYRHQDASDFTCRSTPSREQGLRGSRPRSSGLAGFRWAPSSWKGVSCSPILERGAPWVAGSVRYASRYLDTFPAVAVNTVMLVATYLRPDVDWLEYRAPTRPSSSIYRAVWMRGFRLRARPLSCPVFTPTRQRCRALRSCYAFGFCRCWTPLTPLISPISETNRIRLLEAFFEEADAFARNWRGACRDRPP